MYLASKINRRIDGMRPMLQGSVPLETVWEQTQRALKPLGVKVHFIPDHDIPPAEMSCSGLYDWSRKKQPVEISLHFNSRKRRYNFTEKNWQRFRFLLSQVVQHEFIHKNQFSYRQCFEDGGTCLYYDIKGSEKSDKDHMDYLAELDEIDAYAHDIAMEIRHHYSQHDPYKVLDTINQRKKIWSWNYYREAFKDSEDWSDVRNRLLKKTYLWLPYVTA
jgi:hypothetical protein